MSRLKTFWKEAPFLRLQPAFDDEDSALNDVFGIEFNSKLNRAKFMFDPTVCQSFLLTSLTPSFCLSSTAFGNGDTSTLICVALSDELGTDSFN